MAPGPQKAKKRRRVLRVVQDFPISYQSVSSSFPEWMTSRPSLSFPQVHMLRMLPRLSLGMSLGDDGSSSTAVATAAAALELCQSSASPECKTSRPSLSLPCLNRLRMLPRRVRSPDRLGEVEGATVGLVDG